MQVCRVWSPYHTRMPDEEDMTRGFRSHTSMRVAQKRVYGRLPEAMCLSKVVETAPQIQPCVLMFYMKGVVHKSKYGKEQHRQLTMCTLDDILNFTQSLKLCAAFKAVSCHVLLRACKLCDVLADDLLPANEGRKPVQYTSQLPPEMVVTCTSCPLSP